MLQPLRENDRIVLRDRPWRVRKVTAVGHGLQLLEIEALDGDQPAALSVGVPPEDVSPMPNEAVVFDLRQLESLAAWSRAHRILDATLVHETGVITGARFGRVTLEAYQLAPTLRILSKPRPSLLIADDVGLGKTIEAGLILLELAARGRASRVLVVVPPGLIDQWSEELFDKFGLRFTVLGNASDLAQAQTQLPAGVNPWDALHRVITSIDFLKKETVRNRALRKRWDLVIVDEAHALAESGTPDNPYRTQRTRLGRALREASRGMILLTATPHNGYPHSFRSLLELVEPTLATLRGSGDALQRRIEAARIRRMKSQIRRGATPDGRREPVFPPRHVSGIPVTATTELEKELLRRVASYCSRTAKQAAGTDDAELVGFAMQIVKKRALSSRAALARTIEHRLEALRKVEAREEPPSRDELRDLQADLPVSEAAAERTARRLLRSTIPKDEKRRRAEVQALNGIRRLMSRLPATDPKINAMLTELHRVLTEDPTEKMIVFTEYLDTLESIRAALDSDPVLARRYVTLTGGLTRHQRAERQKCFEHPDARVLLATDAASEGLNLQRFCRRVLHFELPWNPNRLEQRNGRVDRYGQSREPIIRYLYYPDSPEEDVLSRLVEKLQQMAEDRISTPDVLGVLSGKANIEEGLLGLDPEATDVSEQKNALIRLFEDRTEEFVRNVKPLLGSGYSTFAEEERILRLLNTAQPLLPDDAELERTVLEILGRAVTPDPEREGVYRVEVPLAYRGDGVEAVYKAVTFRRSVAVRYRADEVEYVTPLHPLVQAMAADARRRLLQVYPSVRGLPPRRLAARTIPPGEPPSVVFTFLAAIKGGGGLLEEHMLAVRVTTDGRVLGDAAANVALIGSCEETDEVRRELVECLFGPSFDSMLSVAEREAARWIEARAGEIRLRRAEQAEILRRDLDVDCRDRLAEIDEEERRARASPANAGQLSLFIERPTELGSYESRRAAVETHRRQRFEELREFEQVHEPEQPRPLGALFLVPTDGEA